MNTRTFKPGNSVCPLPASARPLTSVEYSLDGITTNNLDDFIRRNKVAGLLVVKDGEIVLERYLQGNTSGSMWASFSIGKSITATLVGIALKEGKIESISDPVTKYLPQMTGTAYEGVTLRNLLQMSSGVKWNEDYRDPSSEFTAMFRDIVQGKAGSTLDLLSKLPRVAMPGTRFLYSTGETFLEGEVLRAALGGEWLSDYLSRKIWAGMGMESDGYWALESPEGIEIAGGFLGMTLRDYGRFGMFILNDGVVNGTPFLPDGWMNEAGKPAGDSPQCDYGALYAKDGFYYPLGYGYNWWAMPQKPWGPWDSLDNKAVWGEDAITSPSTYFHELKGTYVALGIYGQYLHINKKERIVTVVWSTWKDPEIDPRDYETYCFLNALTGILRKRKSGKHPPSSESGRSG